MNEWTSTRKEKVKDMDVSKHEQEHNGDMRANGEGMKLQLYEENPDKFILDMLKCDGAYVCIFSVL